MGIATLHDIFGISARQPYPYSIFEYLETFRENDACSSKHGPSGVQELIGTIFLNLSRVLAQA